MKAPDSKRAWRLQTLLTAVLVLAILVLGNHVAREHLRYEVDLSEDQLFSPSPIGRRMVSELPELLRVKAFFTGNVELGVVQIAKRRLVDQLEEYVETSRGRIELNFVDPNASSEARAEAEALGLAPYPMGDVQGTSRVSQDIWLGLVLRYRGSEVALPFVLPQTFEYAFLSALRGLTREEQRTVGFLVGDGRGGSDAFTAARGLLSAHYRLREILDLELGESIPSDVSILVVARPKELHPRTVFAVDQFLQRGGRALLLVDRVEVDLSKGTSTPLRTGCEALLRAWGVTVGTDVVWDQERCHSRRVQEMIPVAGGHQTAREVRFPYPLWPKVDSSGLSREAPVTAQLPGIDLFWANPLTVESPDAPGTTTEESAIVRTDLVWSSDQSFTVPGTLAAEVDPRVLSTRAVELFAAGAPDRKVMALSVGGRLPSPFAAGAPTPWDPVAQALAGSDSVSPVGITDEPVRSGAQDTQVVVVGDSDWLSDGNFLTDRNRMFFVNMIDWLALEGDLIALRSRVPTERKIEDFLTDERRLRGLIGPEVKVAGEEEHSLARMESEAARAAARRRWFAMASASVGALLMALLTYLFWRFSAGRPAALVLASRAGESSSQERSKLSTSSSGGPSV